MSYFESLSESEETSLMEDVTQKNGAMDTREASSNQKKCSTTKNSTLLDHYPVKKQKSHTTGHSPHSSSDDPVLSQEDIDHLLTDSDLDSLWYDDIT